MTNIYCYCLFDGRGNFKGVYSSAMAAHRDAIKICNRGSVPVYMQSAQGAIAPALTTLRNTFKGAFDIQVVYSGGPGYEARIIKTKLKE